MKEKERGNESEFQSNRNFTDASGPEGGLSLPPPPFGLTAKGSDPIQRQEESTENPGLIENSAEKVIREKWGEYGLTDQDVKTLLPVFDKVVRGVSFEEFWENTIWQIKTVIDNGGNPFLFAVNIFNAWEEKNLSSIEKVYNLFSLMPEREYPPNNGSWGNPVKTTPMNGELFDRFQIRSSIGGGFACPVDEFDTPYSLESRSLKENPDKELEEGRQYFYFKFKITKPDKNLEFESGEVIPWFGKKGGAVQIATNKPFHEISDQFEISEKWEYINDVENGGKKWIRLK